MDTDGPTLRHIVAGDIYKLGRARSVPCGSFVKEINCAVLQEEDLISRATRAHTERVLVQHIYGVYVHVVLTLIALPSLLYAIRVCST